LDVNWTCQDTHETNVMSHKTKEQFEEQKISSSGKSKKLVGTSVHNASNNNNE
jgi:hypothetical protein